MTSGSREDSEGGDFLLSSQALVANLGWCPVSVAWEMPELDSGRVSFRVLLMLILSRNWVAFTRGRVRGGHLRVGDLLGMWNRQERAHRVKERQEVAGISQSLGG